MSTTVLVLLAALVAAGLSGLVPSVVARLPEPEPEVAADDPLAPPDPKRPYVELAAARGLRTASVLVGGLTGAIAADAAVRLGVPGLILALVFLVPVGVALGYVDARTRLLPSALVKPAYPVLLGLLLVGAGLDGTWRVLLGAALGWFVFGGLFLVLNLVNPGGMGYGDVRLSGLLGLVLGYAGLAPLLVGLEAAFVLGAIGGLVPLVIRRLTHRPSVRGYPFGPYMLIGTLIGLAVGQQLLVTLMGGG